MIRDLSTDDLRSIFFDLLGELECGSQFDPQNSAHVSWLNQLLNARSIMQVRSFGLFTEHHPAGFISLLFDEGPPGLTSFGHQVQILDLGFFPSQRGQRLGAKLVAHVESVARREKYYCLMVSTYAKQERAIRFYLREGFIPVATIPDVHGPNDEGMTYLRKRLA